MKAGADLVRALVEQTRDAYDPREEDYERVRTKLRAAAASADRRGPKFGRWSSMLLAAGSVLIVAAFTLQKVNVERPSVSITPAEHEVAMNEPPALSRSVDPTTPTTSVEALPSVVPSQRAQAARLHLPSESQPASSLSEEIRLLRAAAEAAKASDSGIALSFLEDHERRFPKGFLSDERRVQKVLALCDLGRQAQARAEAHRFTTEHPNSPLNARLLSSCIRGEGTR